MDLQKALREGPSFVRNAEDALTRNITNAELLYMWDNQLNAIDAYLANTEGLNGESADLSTLRTKLRDLKKQIERKVMEFEAKQEGEDVPDDPDEGDIVEGLKDVAPELLEMADAALKAKVKDVRGLQAWEDPRDLLNGFLADSEPYSKEKGLAKVRDDIRKRKGELDSRIKAMEDEWRKKDLEGGDDDED